jgi:ligand-binding SRPBCC domain-containing protein
VPLVEVVTLVRASPEVVFDLELDADVHAASMSRSGETATTSTGRPGLDHGDTVTFAARHFGLTWTLVGRITEYDRPHRFVDEQVSGPFRVLRHEHLFEAVDQQTTRMTDRLRFEAPLGPLGAVVGRLVLVPYLRSLLRERGAHVRSLAEGQPPEAPRRRR